MAKHTTAFLMDLMVSSSHESHKNVFTSLSIATRCVSGYEEISGQCYKLYLTYASWYQATEQCRLDGAQLASIHSHTESKDLFHHFHGRTHHKPYHGGLFWIGASKLRAGNTWEWWDGTAWDYANLDGSVKADTESNCLAMKWAWDGKWVDVPCMKIGHRIPFYCKMKKIKSES